jgi:hypothetical protein
VLPNNADAEFWVRKSFVPIPRYRSKLYNVLEVKMIYDNQKELGGQFSANVFIQCNGIELISNTPNFSAGEFKDQAIQSAVR